MTRGSVDSWMWAEACDLIQRAERLHRQFFIPLAAGEKGVGWAPPLDLYETVDELILLVALPGVEPRNIELYLDDGVLTVVGQRDLPVLARNAEIRRLEIPHGRFVRKLRLPSVSLALGDRGIENGCLFLRLIKMP